MTRSRIDVNQHYAPAFYAEAWQAAAPAGAPPLPAWSEDDALWAMDRLGIAKAYLSISSPGVHFGNDRDANGLARLCNEEGARLKRAHPDRFGFFACTPLPDITGRLAGARPIVRRVGRRRRRA